MVAIGDTHVAHHHQYPGYRLGRLVPCLVLERLFRRDSEFHMRGRIHLGADTDAVAVELAVVQLVSLTVLRLGRKDEPAGVLAVADDKCCVGHEGDFPLITALVFGQFLLLFGSFPVLGHRSAVGLRASFLSFHRLFAQFLLPPFAFLGPFAFALLLLALQLRAALLSVETVVGRLEEGNVIVELLHVERAVDAQLAVVHDGVAQRGAIVQRSAPVPVVGGIVVGIGVHPVENGDEIER